MDNGRKKNILLGVLIVGVISMTVAFAALSTNLRLNGTANVAATRWNIHFQSWAVDTQSTITVGTNTQQNTAEYPQVNQLTMQDNSNVTKVSGINVTLKQPNDYARYTFQIINEGTIDADLQGFTHNMECESGKNCDFMEYEVNCYDNASLTGTALTTNSTLTANGGRAYCYLQVKYKDVSNVAKAGNKVQANVAGTNQVYEQEAVSASLSAQWTWVQSTQANNQGGNEPVTPSNPNETTFDGNYTYTSTSGFETNEYGFVPLDFNNEWNVYLRNDGTKNETCTVFPTGTVCMTSSYYNSSYSDNGYYSDFEDVTTSTSDITTAAGLQATGLKGYALSKAEEMLSKGASSCYVYSSYVDCYRPAGGYCGIYNGGNVYCRDGSDDCGVYDDGSVNCN